MHRRLRSRRWAQALLVAVLFHISGASRADAAWTILGGPQLSVPHYRHTATLLADGRLLVAGGASSDTSTPTAVAEILDLPNGASTWAATGAMRSARYRHTAVLLRNGKVLVVGGQDQYTTELFDPATATWSYGPQMSIARAHHTTTLLRDGRVLICGGYSYGGTHLSSVEIYNPATNAITSGPSMAAAHSFHAASLMQDGRVLVVGGFPTGNAAEIYNPATNAWTTITTPAGQLYSPTATTLYDGRVLVSWLTNGMLLDATGTSWTPTTVPHGRERPTATLFPSGVVMLYGGEAADPPSDTADLYTPGVGWSSIAVGNNPESHAATLLPSGYVVLTGRNDGGLSSFPTAAVNIIAPPDAGLSVSSTGSLPVVFNGSHATPLTTGGVLALVDDRAAIYSTVSSSWTTIPAPMQCGRYRPALTLLPDGRVLTVNCDYGRPDCVPVFFNPSTQAWTDAPQLPNRRYEGEATMLTDGRVLITGGIPVNAGYPPSPTSDAKIADVFDYRTNAWAPSGTMSVGRSTHTATLLRDGRVLIAGGQPQEANPVCEIYDPRTGTFTIVAPLNTGRFGHAAAIQPDGDVLVIGGLNANGFTNTVERYDIATNTWSYEAALSVIRNGSATVPLPDGRVLVAGGGSTPASQSSSEVWDPMTRAWIPGPSGFVAMASANGSILPDGRVLVFNEYDRTSVIFTPSATPAASKPSILAGQLAVYSPQLAAPSCNSSASSCDSGSLLIGRDNVQSSPEPNQPNTINSSCADGTFGSFHVDESVDAISVRSVDGSQLGAGKAVLIDVTVWAYSTYQSDALDVYIAPDAASPVWTLLGSYVPANAGVNVISVATTLPTGGSQQAIRALFRYQGSVAPSGCSPGSYDDHDDLAFQVAQGPAQAAPSFTYGTPLTIIGTNLLGLSETSSGAQSNSTAQSPQFTLYNVDSGKRFTLAPADGTAYSTSTASLTFSRLPSGLDVGLYLLHATSGGVRSNSIFVSVGCGVNIASPPASVTAPIGGSATFSITAEGGRSYQWQKDATANGAWANIVGATGTTYIASPIAGADSGARYRVLVTGNCDTVPSQPATLNVADSIFPGVTIVSPAGGDYWLLSPTDGGAPNTRVVTWSMSDNVRICRVQASLVYSDNSGVSYSAAPTGGGLPVTFGPGGSCAFPGEATTSLTYTIPTSFPSGHSGSLYKIQVVVTDQAGNVTTATSPNPFYIVQANPDAVKTLVLWNRARMIARQGITTPQADQIAGKLQELANHPRVQGLVVDLSSVTSLTSLFSTWDADSSNSTKANAVLFGSGGIHEYIRTNLLSAYSGVKYLVIVGDDRIIPMARIQDHTALLPENTYANGVDLSASATTVGQALAAGKYLSDDPLAVLDATSAAQLDGNLFIPDLAVGRLVETPAEIVTTIATYISQDGILDLSLLNATTGHKVLITGYDFLSNVATQMRARWKSTLGDASANTSTAPVDGTLIGDTWGLGSISARSSALRSKLSGSGGTRYGVMAIAGHATHYEEGVPGTNPLDIQGLSTADIFGADSCSTPSLGALDLAGGVLYAVGCHGGLSVPGSCRTDANRSLDLPQTMLARGAIAYVANSGYGWGLKYGIGYGARLAQIFTEQMTTGGTIAVGDAVRLSKQRYYLETPRYDPYDEKSVMQWTLYGLPMYAVKTGIAAGATSAPSRPAATTTSIETVGAVRVQRSFASRGLLTSSQGVNATALPPSLTQLNLSFDFTAAGVYQKHDSQGTLLAAGAGCPDANGCYYTLNGLVDRGTGSGDLPIQPYLIYDSRLAGTSQHGVLWKGGTYDEESNFTPVIAQLVSNGGDGSNHGASPRVTRLRPTAPRVVPGVDSPTCRPSDLEVNSLTITTGEAVRNDSTLLYTTARRYRNVDLETYYFNNRTTPSDNCDRTGPQLGAGPFAGNYHQVTNGASTSTVAWTVPVSDPGGVWRVLIVYSANTLDGQNQGTWTPLDLTPNGGNTTFTGNVTISGTSRLTYVIEAVDNRGNVTWLDFVTAQLPSSGVPLGVPNTVDVAVGPIQPPTGVLATASTLTSVSITWTAAVGAATYDVYRSASGTSFVKLGSTAASAYTDNAAVANTAYLYAIKSIDAASVASPFSVPDLATTVIFTDATLTAGVTTVKAAHITELRNAVNAVRTLAGSGTFSFTDPTITPGVTIAKAVHLTEMRTALAAARSTLSLPAITFTDATLSSAIMIRAVHMNELRNGVR